MREVVGLSLEKDTSTHTPTQVPFRPTCIYCSSVLCVLGILLTGCQVQPRLQNLCDHLLLPLWPSDIHRNTRMSVCVLIQYMWLFSDLSFFSQACVHGSKSVQTPVTKKDTENDGVTSPQTWLFNWSLFKWAMLQSTAKMSRRLKMTCSGTACCTCFLFPPSALNATRRSCRPAWTRGSRQF